MNDWVSRLKNKSLKKGKEKQERERKREQEEETKPALYSLVLYIFWPRASAAPYQMTQRQVEKNKTRLTVERPIILFERFWNSEAHFQTILMVLKPLLGNN